MGENGWRGPGKGGRPVGAVGKFSRLKAEILEAFHHERMGGIEGMVNWACKSDENRKNFYKFIVQLLPKDLMLTGANGGPLEVVDARKTLLDAITAITVADAEDRLNQSTDTGRSDGNSPVPGTGPVQT